MVKYTNFKIERKPEVLNRTGNSRSTLHLRIKQGIFPPPIQIGARAVGWFDSETTAVLLAIISGKSKSEIQEIDRNLIERRKSSLEVLAW